MNHFIYRKDSGELSDREVEPIGFTFGKRNKVLCIDYAGLEEEDKEKLEAIKRGYLTVLYEAGFSDNIRSFFLDNIEEVS